MPTARILHKMATFSHCNDAPIRGVLDLVNATAVVDERVLGCMDPFGRAERTVSGWTKRDDGRLPWLAGWPEHPLA